MIRTMKGEKSNFHISAMSIKPSYRVWKVKIMRMNTKTRSNNKGKAATLYQNANLANRKTEVYQILTTIRMVIETA